MAFDGSSVWITGGGSGLGRAMALEFARQGASIAVSGRRVDRLEQTVKDLQAVGADAVALPCDVNDDDALARCVDQVTSRFGKLDVTVANAGFAVGGKVRDLTRDDWRRQYEVNVFSAAMTAHHAIPALEKTQGRLALIGSVAAWTPFPKNAAYQSSKAAVLSLGRTLSAELAKTGVSCTTIQPGFVESEIGQVDNAGRFDGERSDPRPQRFMWKADDAARVMVRAIDRRKVEFTFTGHGRFAVAVARLAPWFLQAVATRAKI